MLSGYTSTFLMERASEAAAEGRAVGMWMAEAGAAAGAAGRGQPTCRSLAASDSAAASCAADCPPWPASFPSCRQVRPLISSAGQMLPLATYCHIHCKPRPQLLINSCQQPSWKSCSKF